MLSGHLEPYFLVSGAACCAAVVFLILKLEVFPRSPWPLKLGRLAWSFLPWLAVQVVKANLDHVPDLFAKFKVRSTPTFVVLTPNGSRLNQRFRHSGLIKKDQLVGQIQKAIDAV